MIERACEGQRESLDMHSGVKYVQAVEEKWFIHREEIRKEEK